MNGGDKSHNRCAELGVTGYDSIVGNITDHDAPRTLGLYDVVHCSGVIYHVPDPFTMLRNLYMITNKHLILTSMVVVPPIHGKAGSIEP